MPFDHRPDLVLGDALRQALSAENHSAFVARVRDALAVPHVVHWDVLAAWARHGIAAACVGALGAALVVGATQPMPVDLVASLASPSAQELVTSATPPDPSLVLVSPELR